MPYRVLNTHEFTLERIRRRDMLLIDAHSGDYAHGISTNISSQGAFRGVFVAPTAFLLGLDEISFVSDAKTNMVYYELRRFIELLMVNNPAVIEMLNLPSDSIRYRNGLFGILTPELFLSKLCARTYTEYAQEQLSRFQLFNSQNNKPVLPKKNLVDFCYVYTGRETIPLVEWFLNTGIESRHCGLAVVPHCKDIYHIHVDKNNEDFKGLFMGDSQNMRFLMSDIPKDSRPDAHLIFDEKEFAIYNREYREQREREEQKKRSASGEYDAGAFMETVRLLNMAQEIATEGIILTRRPDVSELMKIRSGAYSYSYLIGLVKNLIGEVLVAFRSSPLPPSPNKALIQQALLEIRIRFAEKAKRQEQSEPPSQ